MTIEDDCVYFKDGNERNLHISNMVVLAWCYQQIQQMVYTDLKVLNNL